MTTSPGRRADRPRSAAASRHVGCMRIRQRGCEQREERGHSRDLALPARERKRLMMPSYGDGRPSRRFGQQPRDCPDMQRLPSRTRSGDRPPGRHVPKSPDQMCSRRKTGKAAWEDQAAFFFASDHPRGSPPDSLDAARLRRSDPLLHQGEHFRRSRVRRARIERRRRIVFEPKLDGLRRGAVDQH